MTSDDTMKIAITGCTGMIGSDLAELALSKGIEVVAIVRPNSERLSNINKYKGIEIIEADLKDYNDIKTTSKCDMFFHLAWNKTSVSGRDDVDVQVDNIRYLLDSIRLAKRMGAETFVGAGSQAEYGLVSEPINGDTTVDPISGYGIAKYAGGKMGKLLCDQLGMRFNWARILSVYGIKDSEKTLISYVINTLLKGETPELTPCEQLWDYIYSKDAADAFLSIGLNGKNGRTYTIGSGNGRPLKDYVEDIKNLIDENAKIDYGSKDYYPHQPMYLKADIRQLTEDTGFTPRYSFKEGVKEILDSKKESDII